MEYGVQALEPYGPRFCIVLHGITRVRTAVLRSLNHIPHFRRPTSFDLRLEQHQQDSSILVMHACRKLRGVAFFRTAAFFPYITSIVAITTVWNLLFSPQYGPVNELLRFVGIDNPPGWTTSATWAMPAIIIVGTWREMGYYMILFLAGLQTVPRELYEAARMDGANAWQRFRNVTLPGIRPTTFFVTVMLTIGSFKVFDVILLMTNGGPGQATLVLSQFIYNTGFVNYKFGYASAASIALFLICIVVTIVQFVVNKRRAAS